MSIGLNRDKVLIIVQDPVLSKKVKTFMANFLSSCRFDFIVRVDDAISKLNSFDNYKAFIFCGYTNQDEASFLDINESVESDSLLKVVLYTEEPSKKVDGVHYISSHKLFSDLLPVLSLNFEVTPYLRDAELASDTRFFSIPVSQVRGGSTLPCDLYVKLTSGKMVKLFSVDSPITDEDIERFEKKSLNEFYLTTDDFFKFSDIFYSDGFDSTAFEIDPQKEIERQMANFYETSRELGISRSMIDKVKNINEELINTIQDKEIVNLLENFFKKRGTFLFNHSSLISLLACSFSQTMSWNTKEIQRKLCLASMLHDMGYSSEKYALYDGADEKSLDQLSPEVKKEVLNHTEMILNKISDLPNVSSDVINIIQYHHYGSSHKDFPNNINTQQPSILACLFIMVHNLVLDLYRIGFKKNKIPDVLDSLARKFETGPFEKISKDFINEMNKTLC